MRAGMQQKPLPPLTVNVPDFRTLTVDTTAMCSYLQNVMTMSVSFSSSSHNSKHLLETGRSGREANLDYTKTAIRF